jgi:hypothetical protein
MAKDVIMREIGVRKGRRSRTLGGFQGALKKTTVIAILARYAIAIGTRHHI